MTGGTSFAVSGSNVVTDAVTGSGARAFHVSGGELTFDHPPVSSLISGVTATSDDPGFAPASNAVVWDDLMSTPTPDKTATQGTNYAKMWTPHTGTSSYIQFDLGAAYPLSEIYLWQYNQGGLSGRSIQTANIFYAATLPGQPAKLNTAGWTQYNLPNSVATWPQSSGADGDHTVVDLQNLNFTARYIEIDPTSAWLNSGDVQGGLSKILFYQHTLSFPNTSIEATANSRVNLQPGPLATENDVFDDLIVAGGATLTVGNGQTLTVSGISSSGMSGAAAVSLDAVQLIDTGAIQAASGTSLTLPAITLAANAIDIGAATTYAGSITFGGATSVVGVNAVVNIVAGTAFIDSTFGGVGASVDVHSGATLGGTGTIGIPVTVESGGTLSPGDSPGIITTGDLSLSSGSILQIQLNGTTLSSEYDQVSSSGAVDIHGSLNVTVGYPIADNATFTIIDAPNGDVTGTFSNETPSSVPGQGVVYSGGHFFYVLHHQHDVQLVATRATTQTVLTADPIARPPAASPSPSPPPCP